MDYQIGIGRRRRTMPTMRGALTSTVGACTTTMSMTTTTCVWERLSNFVKN